MGLINFIQMKEKDLIEGSLVFKNQDLMDIIKQLLKNYNLKVKKGDIIRVIEEESNVNCIVKIIKIETEWNIKQEI